MTLGHTRRRTWRAVRQQIVVLGVVGATLLGGALLGGALPGDFGLVGTVRAEPAEQASLEQIKSSLDEIEEALGRDGVTAETLAGHRRTLTSTLDNVRAKVEELEPRVRELEERLKQLGPAPAKDAPPEADDIAKEREELTANFSELDAALKQYRVLSVRIDQLSERLAQKRHALYASELFARSPSILDPFFWMSVGQALPAEWRGATALFEHWIGEHPDGLRWGAAALVLLAIAAITFGLSHWWFPRLLARPSNTRSEKAWTALWVFLWHAARTPLAAFAALMVLDTFGLLTWRVEQIAQALVAGIAAAAFGHGIARALFAPENPARRLIQEDDNTARFFYNHLVWTTRVLGVLIVLQAFHKALFAPLILTVATNAQFGAVTAAFLSDLLFRLGRSKRTQEQAIMAAPWIHPLALVVTALIILALVTGYAGLAAFVALRTIVAAAVFGALYLLLAVTQSLFATVSEQSPQGRMLAANLGVSARGVGFGAALLSAAIRVMLIVFACLLIIGPWEVSTADLFDTIRNIPFGFKIGEIHVSFRALLAAAVVLIVLLVVTRVVRRWLEIELLPRTTLEPSLQLSIATIFGYLGAIAAIAVAMTGLGFDLQKIALIAGALSVGIGFGLQSVVANFVSGLILLTERPIRVGDSIVIKGEEGWVRRVRVRATEIETFDRASVIIPNSELITGIVKNWTRVNTLARVVVKVGVGYECDPAQVRSILTDIASSHPQIVQAPPPAAYLLGFGDSALEFELRCIVNDVEKSLSVRSDLHYSIIERFRAAGISIPYPQRELRVIDQKPAVAAEGKG